ncbi:MerR family transcriptional regulator [Cryptosporangium phraense]|uniref:MerR family transcriptional regulator n=1 Tax=Cryptosporangium phraense TaxID=2593070 RepID=A0A545AP03_9ACTN|nr:MerR family transcriptional regulator [Cryptosporangium phraense]TQS43064.1 MerR family transcriptional regulator [Cryptosporangium phraense]
MRLLTIGAFARRSGLTPKALRLYDSSGLLPPVAVDPESGYRFYDPAQLDTARLIAELRRIGMPLAEIRTVCTLDGPAAAEAVAAYWRRVTAENAVRARVAGLLLEHLSGRNTMSTTLTVRYATASEPGDVRDVNDDSVHASDHLLAVADGVRGPSGAAASAAAIAALVESGPADARLLSTLVDAVEDADRRVRAVGGDTTLTALVRNGSQLGLVHVGDTRAYLVRAGELVQLTTDHTWVQTQIDQGRLSLEGAAGHPQRALLTRALGVGASAVEADLGLRTALPGDRYLLCSDGVSAVVARPALHSALTTGDTPDDVVGALVRLVHDAGAPDNLSCVVADFVAV